MTRLFVFAFFVLFLAKFITAAPPRQNENDDMLRVPWFTEQQLESPFEVDTSFLETSSTGFHRYDPFNRYHLFMAHKGNIGHPGTSLLFMPDLFSDFSLYPEALYPGYLLSHENIRWYRPEHVFTDLQYILGDNREQLFIANHNQKLHETLHIGAVYQIINSPGFYSRLGARNSYIRTNIDFQESGKRYQALASMVFNRKNNHESGGLADHQEFEENPNRESIILNNAVSRYNENAFSLNHSFNLGFHFSRAKDTLADQRFLNLGRISHRFSYRRLATVFDEFGSPHPGFYEMHTPVFATNTYDSTVVNTLENQIKWSNFPLQDARNPFPVNFSIFVKHQVLDIYQPDLAGMHASEEDSYLFEHDRFIQLISGFEIQSDPNRVISARGRGSLISGGYNDGDYDFGGSLHLGIGKGNQHSLALTSHFAEKEAPYFMSRFQGNYVSWNNDFEKSNWISTTAHYSNQWITLGANYYSIKNMVFMGSEALPVQNQNTVNVLSASLQTEFGYGIVRTQHNLIYQKADDDNFINFPELAGYHSLFFDFSLFDRALGVQTGVDLFFNMAYAPMGYMPVVRQFYAQDFFPGRDNYLINIFANFKISRSRLFVKLENVVGLVTDTPPVYLIPFYPIPEGAFKFGVSWMFFD